MQFLYSIVLCVIAFLITIGISRAYFYFYWYLKKDVIINTGVKTDGSIYQTHKWEASKK